MSRQCILPLLQLLLLLLPLNLALGGIVDVDLVDKRAPFSSWAGKRSLQQQQHLKPSAAEITADVARLLRDLRSFYDFAEDLNGDGDADLQQMSKRAPFSSWAGKRAPFSSWAGKRAPFSSWAGRKRRSIAAEDEENTLQVRRYKKHPIAGVLRP